MKHRIKEGECVVTHTDEERKALGFETNLGGAELYCTGAEVIDPCTALRRNMSSISFADFVARENISDFNETEKLTDEAFDIDIYVPKGDIEGFPVEVVKWMLREQEAQGNKRDTSVFESDRTSGHDLGGFDWCEAKELDEADARKIITVRDFGLFFEMRPKSTDTSGVATGAKAEREITSENENQLNRVRTYLADLISVGECVNIYEPAHIHDIADYIRLSVPTVKVQDMLSAAENDGLIHVKKYTDRVVWMDVSGDVDSMKCVPIREWNARVRASGWAASPAAKPVIEVDFSEVETAAKLHEKGKELLAESRKAMDVPKEQSYNITGAPAENFLLASLRADVKRMLEIAEAKNHDYGGKDSNPFANFMAVEHLGAASAEAGIAVRMTDKLSRIITLLNKDAKVSDESITDTLLDLANYALILKALIAYKKQLSGPAVH